MRLPEVISLSRTTYRQATYWAQKGWLGAAIELVDKTSPLQASLPGLEASSTSTRWVAPAIVTRDDHEQGLDGWSRTWPWNAVLRASLIKRLVDAGASLVVTTQAAAQYPDHLDEWLHFDNATGDLRWAANPGRVSQGAWFDVSRLHTEAWRAYVARSGPPWTAPPDIVA